MDLREAVREYKQFKIPSLSEIQKKASQHSKTSLVIIILLFALLLLALQYIPHYQVSQFNITNQKDLADAENSYRATLAQIFGGVAIAIGIYYTWRRITIAEEDLKTTQENLKVARESQITERFTRAVEQLGAIDNLGNPAIEIRLGGIYALERIANESEKDYWPIMEILTAYLRKNSYIEYGEKTFHFEYSNAQKESIEVEDVKIQAKVSLDIHAIITVIRRRRYFLNSGEDDHLDLQGTNLREANFQGANLQGADLKWTYFGGANFREAKLQEADLKDANLQEVIFVDADLAGTNLTGTYLRGTNLVDANLKGANLNGADLRKAFLQGINLQDATLVLANFERVNLEGVNLKDADLMNANLDRINLRDANLGGANLLRAYLGDAHLEGTNFERATFEMANLEYAELKGAINLTVDQLSKVKTLYKAELDEELEEGLRAKGFGHLIDNEPK